GTFARGAAVAAPFVSSASVLPQYSNHSSLYLYGSGGNHNRWHGGVRRLQADLVAFDVNALQSGVTAVHQRNHDLAIARDVRLFHQDIVTIDDVLVLHTLARHLEDEHLFGAREVGQRDGLGILQGLERAARGDAPHERQTHAGFGCGCRGNGKGLLHAPARLQQINRAAAVVVAPQQLFLLKVGDVLVHRSQRVQAEAFADFVIRRRIAVRVHERGDEVIHLFLTARESHDPSASIVSEKKAKSQQGRLAW